MFAIIKSLLQTPARASRVVKLPRLRNMIWDIMDEGRRKNIIHAPFEVNATAILAQVQKSSNGLSEDITLTSYLAKVLADCVARMPEMQAYLNRRKQLVVFEDVDLSVMIERKVEGRRMPVPYIVRDANKMNLHELDAALRCAKTAPLYKDGPVSALEAQFFSLPRPIRKLAWFFIRRSPHLFREVAGTVGVTSLPWHSDRRGIGLPISPMTLTLLVGAIIKEARWENGKLIEQETIQLNLSADHNVIDGSQLVRFMALYKKHLIKGAVGRQDGAKIENEAMNDAG